MKSDLAEYTQNYCKSEQIIIRTNKLKELESLNNNKYVYFFYGAPGQGKSVFARQVAENLYYEYIWYEVSEADKDPLFLCQTLHNKFTDFYPRYSCEEFEKPVAENKLDPLQYEFYIKSIIRSLKKVIKKRIVIIFDKVDTLPPIGLAYKAILSATSLCSYVVHFIVCSRDINHTPTLNNKQESYTYILNNDFFTFTPNEYKSLSLLYLNELTEFSGLDKIYNITEGWVYGIVSAFSFINNHGKLPEINDLADHLDVFFRAIELHNNDAKEFHTLTLLSLLNDIKIDFAIRHHGNTNIAKYLITLLDTSTFIRRSSSTGLTMHPLYAAWLSNICYRQIRKKIDIELFLIQAADYELEQNYLPNALKYLIKAKTYSKLEQVIKENIDSFIITKHEHTLFSILSDIPPTIFRNSLWMPLAYSLVTKCVSLEKTEHMLLHTLMNFEKHNNHIGVLLSCCGLISYQHFIGGDIIKCRKYFHKAGELFKAHGNELSQYKLLEIYTALAIGCIFTEEECDTKKNILDKAASLANTLQAGNHLFVLNHLFSVHYEQQRNIGLSDKYLNLIVTGYDNSKPNSFKSLFTMMSIYHSYSKNGFFSELRRSYRQK